MSSKHNINDDFRDTFELIVGKWKLILFCIIIAIGLAFAYLRYATYEYQATASIKINSNNDSSSQLPELSAVQNYGLFSSDFTNISDEIEIMKSRTILRKVIDELDLNIQYFELGRIKETELYKNPPINISFYEGDSIINQIDTTLYIKINSKTKFSLSSVEKNKILDLEDETAKTYSFGDKIATGFGNIVITPNSLKADSLKVGTNIKLNLISVDRMVDFYKTKISIVNSMGSDIVTLNVNDNLKERASLILNKLVEKYNEDVANDKAEIVKATSDFINDRLNLVSQELEQVDFSAESLQKQNRLTALGSQTNIYLASEKENENKVVNTTNNIQLIKYLQQELKDKSSNEDVLPADIGISDNGTSQIIKAHNDLVQQRNRMLKNSSDKNPIVIRLANEINSLKQTLKGTLNTMKSTNEITLSALNQEGNRIRGQIYSAPTKQRQITDIKRQQNIKESLYLYLLEKREESAINQGLSSNNAKIIDRAYTGSLPISPKKGFIYMAALVLGTMLPIIFVYLSNLLDTKIHTKKDLMKVLSIPFIGDIPRSERKKRVIKKIDYSPKAEAFRIIRSNIDFMLKSRKHESKTMFVTSTRAQEGKSHTSINLASSLSFSKKSTLLIEADIRVPKVKEYLELEGSKNGLTDYISDESIEIKDVISTLKDNEYLSIIHSGSIPPNPAELLMSDRMHELFKFVKDKYDYIVVDTAAVGLVTDTFLISDFADMFIYVVSAENIDKRALENAQTLYEEKRLPNMTVLLNGTTKTKRGYGYGYGNNPNRKKKWYQFKKS
ncbi:polysaccharide biosynthesis tyrosine autokinase [Winogradskyella litoriviva]|uniref:non-specific protein-tyrosine kinase n=1 Tax=Winogradskyella litoriviva TaxID=1220182 RepID=A0ABX2E5E0_9FLAO|nr:polysaccharide biosynthesis tyrosine autokinase [Winogradskyella litoriviva]NRD23514.1 polysaccharide biosynthesis tyrosine autokinase [Winogradskyella litoriviva]